MDDHVDPYGPIHTHCLAAEPPVDFLGIEDPAFGNDGEPVDMQGCPDSWEGVNKLYKSMGVRRKITYKWWVFRLFIYIYIIYIR